MENEGRLTLSVPEAAKILGIGRNTAYEAVRKGDIPAIFIGKRILISRAGLEQMLESTGHKQEKAG